MTDQDIAQLAAILVDEHGPAALDFAEDRRAQFARKPLSEAFRLWTRIAQATARLLRARHLVDAE
jgi:hypothetical protein